MPVLKIYLTAWDSKKRQSWKKCKGCTESSQGNPVFLIYNFDHKTMYISWSAEVMTPFSTHFKKENGDWVNKLTLSWRQHAFDIQTLKNQNKIMKSWGNKNPWGSVPLQTRTWKICCMDKKVTKIWMLKTRQNKQSQNVEKSKMSAIFSCPRLQFDWAKTVRSIWTGFGNETRAIFTTEL